RWAAPQATRFAGTTDSAYGERVHRLVGRTARKTIGGAPPVRPLASGGRGRPLTLREGGFCWVRGRTAAMGLWSSNRSSEGNVTFQPGQAGIHSLLLCWTEALPGDAMTERRERLAKAAARCDGLPVEGARILA